MCRNLFHLHRRHTPSLQTIHHLPPDCEGRRRGGDAPSSSRRRRPGRKRRLGHPVFLDVLVLASSSAAASPRSTAKHGTTVRLAQFQYCRYGPGIKPPYLTNALRIESERCTKMQAGHLCVCSLSFHYLCSGEPEPCGGPPADEGAVRPGARRRDPHRRHGAAGVGRRRLHLLQPMG